CASGTGPWRTTSSSSRPSRERRNFGTLDGDPDAADKRSSVYRSKEASMATPSIDEFLHKLVGDLGASTTTALVGIGDRLGLYKALASGPMTPAELAKKTGTDERYIREWLCAQAAAGYVDYDAAKGTFSMNEAQTLAFADDSSPAHFLGGFQVVRAIFKDLDT